MYKVENTCPCEGSQSRVKIRILKLLPKQATLKKQLRFCIFAYHQRILNLKDLAHKGVLLIHGT